MAKATDWTSIDAEVRKRGEQTGLDTHAFAPQRQYRTSEPPSPLVFFLISTNFTSTLGIPLTSIGLELSSIKGSSEVELRDFTSD